MKSLLLKITIIAIIAVVPLINTTKSVQEFQGKAVYITKSKMELGRWGARLSAAEKKQVAARLKNRLEKTYLLTFNKTESFFKEDEKLDAMSGATDSWGKNFSPGDQYKNIKTNSQVQAQEFYGKKFLVKDSLQPISWQMGEDTKQIGKYTCFKATAQIPTSQLTWYNFSWSKLRQNTEENMTNSEPTTLVEAWYSPQIPVSHGPLDYWGLPGLILEVSAGNTTMLCSKIILNPSDKTEIIAPSKGKQVTKMEYQSTIINKMKEFRNNRGRRRG